MKKKSKPFTNLSSHKKRDLFVRMRWQIKRDTQIFGGMFTSYHYIPEPGSRIQDADFSFCGTDGLTIWKASIMTATQAFLWAVRDMAFARADGMLTPEERHIENGVQCWELSGENGVKCLGMGDEKGIAYEKFGNLSYFDYVDKLEDEIIRDNPPAVYESFSTDFSYQHGIGLKIVISADEINRFTIEEAIRHFQKLGERNWRSGSPVPVDTLPKSAVELPLVSCHSFL